MIVPRLPAPTALQRTFSVSHAEPWRRDLTLLVALVAAGTSLALLTIFMGPAPIDRPATLEVQRMGGWYTDIAWVFNRFLRDIAIPIAWVATVAGLLAWRRWHLAVPFILAVAVIPLTWFLKFIVDRPRPAGGINVLEFPSGNSFPSGHVMTAMAFFGTWFIISSGVFPARVVPWVRAGCVLAVVMTAVSRIWVGAHWPTDVIGGFLWGSALLVAVAMTVRELHRS